MIIVKKQSITITTAITSRTKRTSSHYCRQVQQEEQLDTTVSVLLPVFLLFSVVSVVLLLIVSLSSLEQQHYIPVVSAWVTSSTSTSSSLLTRGARQTRILPSTATATATRMRIVLNLLNNNNYINHRIRCLPVLAHIDSSSLSSSSSSLPTPTTLSSSSSFLSKQTNKYTSNNNWFSRKFFNSNSKLQMTTTSTSTTPTTPTKTTEMMADQNNDTIAQNEQQTQQEKEKEHEELIQLVIDSLCNDESNNNSNDNNNNCNFGGIDYTNTYYTSNNSNISTTESNNNNKYRVLFVLGGPGAGKGTQSELMVQNYPIEHYSVGQLLRDELVAVDKNDDVERTIRRKLIQSTLDSGNIVPVEISLSLLYDTMKQSQQKQIIILVDGFPRNYDNLIGWCSTMNTVTSLLGVLVYICPLQILEQRILQRSILQPGRSDDNSISLQKRFITFQQQTIPVTSLLRQAVSIATSTESKSASLVESTSKEEAVITDNNNSNNSNTTTVRLSKYYEVIDIQGDQSIDTVWETTQQILNKYIINDVLSTNVVLLHSIETNNIYQYKQLTAKASNFTTTNNDDNDIQLLMTLYQQEQQLLLNSLSAITATQEQQEQETPPQTPKTIIKNATINVISGKCIELQYDRYFVSIDNENNNENDDSSSTICVTEKRTWEHHGQSGWQLVQTIIKLKK